MSKTERTITRDDLMPIDQYADVRAERRRALLPAKKLRRMEVGPYATFYFESYETMWLQIHEMLYIEKGGEAQIADELTAYNPLVPKGTELVATVMFEINDEERRDRELRKLGHIENNLFLQVGDEKIYALAESEVERTKDDGKTSAVHFLHFRFSDAQIAAFRGTQAQVLVGCDHANYAHMAVLSGDTRTELSQDFN